MRNRVVPSYLPVGQQFQAGFLLERDDFAGYLRFDGSQLFTAYVLLVQAAVSLS
jgi:hypothetical protein